jgi:hypothetical protein
MASAGELRQSVEAVNAQVEIVLGHLVAAEEAARVAFAMQEAVHTGVKEPNELTFALNILGRLATPFDGGIAECIDDGERAQAYNRRYMRRAVPPGQI